MAAPRKRMIDRALVVTKAARWVQFEHEIENARRFARIRQEGPVRHLTRELVYELSSLKRELGPAEYGAARRDLFESLGEMLGLEEGRAVKMFTPEDGEIRRAGL